MYSIYTFSEFLKMSSTNVCAHYGQRKIKSYLKAEEIDNRVAVSKCGIPECGIRDQRNKNELRLQITKVFTRRVAVFLHSRQAPARAC